MTDANNRTTSDIVLGNEPPSAAEEADLGTWLTCIDQVRAGLSARARDYILHGRGAEVLTEMETLKGPVFDVLYQNVDAPIAKPARDARARFAQFALAKNQPMAVRAAKVLSPSNLHIKGKTLATAPPPWMATYVRMGFLYTIPQLTSQDSRRLIPVEELVTLAAKDGLSPESVVILVLSIRDWLPQTPLGNVFTGLPNFFVERRAEVCAIAPKFDRWQFEILVLIISQIELVSGPYLNVMLQTLAHTSKKAEGIAARQALSVADQRELRTFLESQLAAKSPKIRTASAKLVADFVGRPGLEALLRGLEVEVDTATRAEIEAAIAS